MSVERFEYRLLPPFENGVILEALLASWTREFGMPGFDCERLGQDVTLWIRCEPPPPVRSIFEPQPRWKLAPVPDEAWTHPRVDVRRRLQKTLLSVQVMPEGHAPLWVSWWMLFDRPLELPGRPVETPSFVEWIGVSMRRSVDRWYVVFKVRREDGLE